MSDADAPELYRKYRPTKLSEMVGQEAACRTLAAMGKSGKVPHCLLLSGPSGCGKTTAARILRRKLGCGDSDFSEINVAKETGIDGIRRIEQRMGLSPIGGRCRVWLLDEVQQLSKQGQSCLLKMLEDTPAHVYFMLATTDPQRLLPTIRTRATEVKFSAVSRPDLSALVRRTAEAEGIATTEDVVDKIAEYADGSPRKALVLLHAVAGVEGEKAQLAAVAKGDFRAEAIELARAIMGKGASWSKAAKIIKELEDDAEGVRRMLLVYAEKILLGGGPAAARAYLVIDCLRENVYDSGRPGLSAAVYEVFNGE